MADFLFALCNPGSERAMKAEVAAMGLVWKSSYQRRGFVSFKLEEGIQEDSLTQEIACARRLCRSIGKFSSRVEAASALEAEGVSLVHHARYHLRKMQGMHDGQAIPNVGDVIGTVVGLDETEFWAGVHRHTPWLSPDPAGDGGLEMPESAPSRAWLKLEEAARFWSLDFKAGEMAIELGCSPGGVVYALMQHGLSVIGVDPAGMDEVVTARGVEQRERLGLDAPGFYHCRKPAALVSKRELGEGLDWFLSDMNQNPEVTLKECARIVKMAPTIRGVLITLKLSEMEAVERKAEWIQSLGDLGFNTLRLQQLAVHHRELALLGLR